MKDDIEIKERDFKEITGILSRLLADIVLLYLKTKKFYWNFKGLVPREAYSVIENQSKELEETADQVAWHIRQFGVPAIGTTHDFLQLTDLKMVSRTHYTSDDLMRELVDDYERIIESLQQNITNGEDIITQAAGIGFLKEMTMKCESAVQALRAHIQWAWQY